MELVNKPKIEERKQVEKQQEFKFIGAVEKKRGQSLYAKDNETNEVYKVIIEQRKVFDTTKDKEVSTYKATVNPNHLYAFALNIKNAQKKFDRM